MPSYICETEFEMEDINHKGYSLCEYDLYQWIPNTIQEKLGLPNHRLKIWRNISSREFELVMDIMQNLHRVGSYKYLQERQFCFINTNTPTGKSIIIAKGTLKEIVKKANEIYKDTWGDISQKQVFQDLGLEEMGYDLSKCNENIEDTIEFIACEHKTTQRAMSCKLWHNEEILKKHEEERERWQLEIVPKVAEKIGVNYISLGMGFYGFSFEDEDNDFLFEFNEETIICTFMKKHDETHLEYFKEENKQHDIDKYANFIRKTLKEFDFELNGEKN